MQQDTTPTRTWMIGVDVGGTFTDGVLIRPGAETLAVKTPTMSHDPVKGLLTSLDAIAAAAGTSRSELLGQAGKFAYGTTQAANMVVEGVGAETAFLTTAGFRDTLVIAGIGRDRIGQDLTSSRAPSLVARGDIHEVAERVDAKGRVLAPLDEDAVRALAAELRAKGTESVGVCFLWSFVNDEHEARVAEIFREEGDWFVTASSECAPVLGEYERSATTALNALLGPPVRRHLMSVNDQLVAEGLPVRPLVMTSAGGLLSLSDASETPVSLLSSGPAGGVLACRDLAGRMGLKNVITGDMGGTTFDVSLITDGEVNRSDRTILVGQEIATAAVDIVSVGAGGGSIAWVERGQRLKIGPRSAGAFPGPACYGRGGEEPTTTDANLVLGRLNSDGLAKGSLSLDREASLKALQPLGEELGVSAEEAAAGMLAIVDAAMADAIRAQTVSRGLDPREYTYFAFGGGGALHAASIAQELGIRHVVIPQLGPVFSAYGIVSSDIQHVLTRSVPVAVQDVGTLGSVIAELEHRGDGNLELDGVPREDRRFVRMAKMRFRGQMHSVDVQFGDGPVDTALTEAASRDFVAKYESLFGAGTASPDAGIEVVTISVHAVGRIQRPEQAAGEAVERTAEPVGTRRTWTGTGFEEVPRYVGPLEPGVRVPGPALIDLPGTSVWLPAAATAHIDTIGSVNLLFGDETEDGVA
ncbi:hydantoinase/oxoprolinase family protein [Streptomyces sp. NPDC052077]|uniref:hydantoinase/oxoprolinase family protein n=1 Tax=Streptomyces sp. NPDC052077 TaxID=3154757 RepID=UPI00342E72A1